MFNKLKNVYCCCRYGDVLALLGLELRDFLSGLDNLHEYLKFSYPRYLDNLIEYLKFSYPRYLDNLHEYLKFSYPRYPDNLLEYLKLSYPRYLDNLLEYLKFFYPRYLDNLFEYLKFSLLSMYIFSCLCVCLPEFLLICTSLNTFFLSYFHIIRYWFHLVYNINQWPPFIQIQLSSLLRLRAPSYFVDNESATGLMLHYRSEMSNHLFEAYKY